MSPLARWGRRSPMVVSTAAAGTISHTARGVSSFFTRSAIDEAPTALAWVNSSIAFGDRSKTTHWWRPASRRWTMLAPMRPSPIIPICITQLLWVQKVHGSGCCRFGGPVDPLNRSTKPGVVLAVGLLGRQPLDQRPRKARHDAVIPRQAPVAFFPRVPARQRHPPDDLGMADELRVQVV